MFLLNYLSQAINQNFINITFLSNSAELTYYSLDKIFMRNTLSKLKNPKVFSITY